MSARRGDGAPGFLASFAALVWLVGRDSAGQDPWLGLFLFAGAAFGLLGFLLVDIAGATWPIGRGTGAGYRRIAALVACAPLVVLAVLMAGSSSAARAPEVIAAGLAVAAAAALFVDRVAPRLGAPDTPRFWFGAIVAGLQLMALFVYVQLAEGTFVAVRSDSERLHQALFFGTWVASVALLVPWAGRIAGRAGTVAGAPGWWGWAAVAAIAGAGALAADRQQMVGLYPAVHLWLECVGVLSLDAALGRLVRPDQLRAWRVPERAIGALRRLGVVALAAILGGAAGFAVVALGGLVTDRAFRANVSETAVGPALLRVARGEAGAGPVVAVALSHDRYHNVPPPENDWNIILLSIDAFRGDFVPDPDRADKSGAPRLAELASSCVDFRRAYAPGSRTMIGMGGLMIGRYSAHIDWQLWLWDGKLIDPNAEDARVLDGDAHYTTIPKIPPEGNLAQRLRAAGLWTMATPWDGHSKFFRKGAGFDAGFEDYVDFDGTQWHEPASANVLKLALEQIDRAGDRRFFQWIHLFDPHASKGDRRRYTELVREMDGAIGTFVDELGRRGLRERTAIVLLADHGEALGEHGHGSHATSLYEEQVKVPLLVCLPGRPGKVFRRPVSTLDAAATVLALAGANLRGIDGVNLLPLIEEGRYPERRPVFADLHRYQSSQGERTVDLQAVILDDWKLIRDLKADTVKLFNLREDPKEETNIVAAEPALAAELEGMLEALAAARPEPKPPPPLFSAKPAAFEVTDSAALLWAHVTMPARLYFEIASEPEFAAARVTPTVAVDRETDLTLIAEVGDLAPGTRYYYRPVLLHEGQRVVGDAGTFVTAASEPRAVRIAWSADLMADHKPYGIFDALRREKPDLFLMLGDTMYADIPKKNAAKDLKSYRARHWAVRRDGPLQAFLQSTATAAIWDDHEISNNSHRNSRHLDLARRVFREQWPVRSADSAGRGLYRSLRPAPQVEVFILDLRSERDPPEARTTMLGAAQKAWFVAALKASTARAKIVVSTVPLLAPFGEDNWRSFTAERDEIRALLAEQGAVVVSGDFHMAWHLKDPETGLDEFVAGPLGAWTFKKMKPKHLPEVAAAGGFAIVDGLNFGVLDISPEGAVTVRYLDVRGKERYRVDLKPAVVAGSFDEAQGEGAPRSP